MQRQISTTSAKAFQYPSGQLGHLTEDQQSAFDKFKQLLTDRKVYVPGSEGRRPSHDDPLLLRFLRARKFDPNAAVTQFTETEQWRKDLGIEDVYNAIDIEEYEETRRLYPMWVGRRDKRGFPVYVFEVGSLDTSKVAATDHARSLEQLQSKTSQRIPGRTLRLLALYEHLIQFVNPWCTAVPSRAYAKTAPITQGCNIIDISGLGFRKAYGLKSHLQDSSQTSTKHYPETLDKIFIIGAPSFFPTLWQWIKYWLDPIVVSKIFITSSSDVLSTLSKHIDPKDIPKKYGGELEWKWGDLPNYDPEMLKLISPSQTELKLPIGPTRWIEGKDGEMVLLATGSEGGVDRRKELLKLDTKWQDVMFFTARPDHKEATSDTAPGDQAKLSPNGTASDHGIAALPNEVNPETSTKQQTNDDPLVKASRPSIDGDSTISAPTAPGPPAS